MPSLPFSIRRISLLARGARVDRNRPRFDDLRSITDPEKFVWAILPHAARSFGPSILLLPEGDARTAAVGYLYARMLDTYEDLSDDPARAREALSEFSARFATGRPGPAPATPNPSGPDQRDLAHLLLVDRHQLVDDMFMTLAPPARERIRRLIGDMASGMTEFSAVFEAQGGVLEDDRQVLDYCHRVIGLPALFIVETLLGQVTEDHQRDSLRVSELVQLANITRDIEKDLRRGVAYHPSLRAHLGSTESGPAQETVASARRHLIRLATRRAGAFRRLVDAVGLPRLSPARAAAVLMALFTNRHYRNCAVEAGMSSWSTPGRMSTLVLMSLPAAVSPRWTTRLMIKVETDLLAVAD